MRELMSSDGWRRWVETRSRFHSYSFGNTLLIALQRPDATQVAGFNVWKTLGRHVRKGERGIRILAPMSVKVGKAGEQVRDRTPEGETRGMDEIGTDERPTRTLFKSVAVFDVSQTDGAELPEPPAGEPITGDSHADYLPRLERFAESIGFTVEYRELGEACGGYCKPSATGEGGGEIVVDARKPVNGRVRTLVHETAHALGVGYREYGRERAEVIVESAAAIVCGSIGLDTSGESVPYIAGWGESDDLEALKTFAGKVDELARRLESALEVV